MQFAPWLSENGTLILFFYLQLANNENTFPPNQLFPSVFNFISPKISSSPQQDVPKLTAFFKMLQNFINDSDCKLAPK